MTDEQREKNKARCKANYAAHRAERLDKQRRYASERRESERARAAAWRAKYPDKHKAMMAAYRTKNRDAVLLSQRVRRHAHRDARNAQQRAKYAANRQAIRAREKDRRAAAAVREHAKQKTAEWRAANPARARAACRSYARRNPGVVNALSKRHQVAKRQAVPAWTDHSAVRAIYEEAARLTRETGIQHDIDHIYPLQGRTVSGLHVEHNLQILTHVENVRKGNKFPKFIAA